MRDQGACGRAAGRQRLLLLLLSLPLAAFVLGLGACLPVGLGDPEASRVDARLAGAWMQRSTEDSTPQVLVLVPFDARAYLFRSVEVERDDEGRYRIGKEGAFKAWLATVGDRLFLSIEPLYLPEAAAAKKRPGTIVARVEVAADGKSAVVTGINPDFPALAPLKALPGHINYEAPAAGQAALPEKEARALLQRVVTENAGSKDLYLEPETYDRVADAALLEVLFETVVGD